MVAYRLQVAVYRVIVEGLHWLRAIGSGLINVSLAQGNGLNPDYLTRSGSGVVAAHRGGYGVATVEL